MYNWRSGYTGANDAVEGLCGRKMCLYVKNRLSSKGQAKTQKTWRKFIKIYAEIHSFCKLRFKKEHVTILYALIYVNIHDFET